ncbi:hypothetical protein JNJ66_00115 [Candidatus Saccharibacteria bacterium]|nr:hypothetical protein [Candidatus Saccharibacteria bacterium]
MSTKVYSLVVVITLVCAATAISLLFSRENAPHRTDTINQERPINSNSATTNIEDVKSNGVVVTESPPEGWTTHQSSALPLEVALPSDWVANDSVTKIDAADEANKMVTISKAERDPNPPCTVVNAKVSIKEMEVSYEETDYDDNGKIDARSHRVIADIKQKESFTYNGNRAVKYTVTFRNERQSESTTMLKYLIEGDGFTTQLSCYLSEQVSEKFVEDIVKYSRLIPS